jgi:hypothetical protein
MSAADDQGHPDGELEEAPEPMGAKATEPDPRFEWREERARLGGYQPPVEFSELQTAVLNAVADTIIPPGGNFPAPSEVEVVEFMGRYVTPADREVKYFPLAAEETFKSDVESLGQEFLDAPADERTERLQALEDGEGSQVDFFDQLRALTYYGYYRSPVVVEAIRQNLPAGADYNGPPQPYGYAGSVEPWPEETPDHGRGSYVETEDVVRVDIPDDLKAEYGVA